MAEQRPAVMTETPLASSAFVDSIGVNLHMTYGGTPYDADFAKWAPILIASGIKHVRDAICLYSLSFCRDVVSARLNQLSAAEVRVDLLTSLKDSLQYDASYARTMGLNNVEAIEGPNECDTDRYCPSNWRSTEAAWQKAIYAFRSPTVTVIGPSMYTQTGYTLFGDLSAFMDVGNIHDYVGSEPPETQAGLHDHMEWAAALSGAKPVWATEVGYSTSNDVPKVVQERYIARVFLENLRYGVVRTYVYQLFDYGPDAGAYMGLLNADYTPKPTWTRLEQMIALFKDDGPSPRAPLTYAIRNDALNALHHVLFQRSDGTYMLAMWLATSSYNASTHSVLTPNEETVSVALPASVASATQTQFLDGGAQKSIPLSMSNGIASVPVSSLVSVLIFKV